ncbi:carboxypeptidase regulatory-like domain-containing protein [Streptomyces sp. RY43-2]|uniref:Carboxypeptidase regulatory-like domain-containing protein n=1 Tax=Streptomyces macrolidinus TaxID=2952607 RepID=A0ABT0ZB93_9ACTN|nr:carboxypeptidase regulatory-like domain-containing protein [Streptomyces macrolidinus]MCN9241028.1 carboxypeptidase regulatory-like domain-containing protein [Streptomyces macrolidinus]
MCGTPKPGDVTCLALHRTDLAGTKGVRSAAPSGWGASDLRSAYNLPNGGGAGRTIAIVDAFDNPTAEADLAVYRAQFGLPECTTANGCFRKVDQRGGTDYPTASSEWAGEISLDLDMASAAAPGAHILLVEADSAGFEDMGAAVDQAVAMGAQYVSNSYGSGYSSTPGSGEDPSEVTELDAHYNHPGVAMVASSGDSDYGVSYPAASQYVTAVGGTALKKDTATARGWSESVWHNSTGGPGSGCSMYEPKPAFQTDTGCDMRSVADVSAVADPLTGVAVYQTYGGGGWGVYGGTSASAPIIAGVYAAAGAPAPGSYPNAYPYQTPSALNDVTSGANGSCTPSYLCTAGPGYDGPTGLGTPNGLAAFRSGPHGEISGTVTDGAGAPLAGAAIEAGDFRATTDADGHYSLTVTPGTYDVTAAAYGYRSGRTTGVVVAEGGSVTESFSLDAVARRTVTGKVTDGSGHGWPLYAAITVDGMPGGPVFTDPYTGTYELQLPVDRTYTLDIAARYPGYQAVSKDVTATSSAQTVNVAVPVDPDAGTAVGYKLERTGTTEPFDSTTAPPSGWSVVNADGTDGGWDFSDPRPRNNHTGGSGAFAMVDSDLLGSNKSQDSSLISPVYDLSGLSAPEIAFDTDYLGHDGQSASVDITTDGGTTWTSVWTRTSTLTGPAHVEIPLTKYAGASSVKLRFHFAATWGWWWQVDNVHVGDRTYVPVTGGLVAGTVTDANTGDGVDGATVTNTDASGQSAVTAATPDDPELGGGFYWMFSDTVGKHAFTAEKDKYTSGDKTVRVAADSTTESDHALKAGQLVLSPATVDKTLAWSATGTQKLTVKNTGGAPATFDLSKGTGGFQTQAAHGAPLQRVKGEYSPLPDATPGTGAKATSTAAGDAWQPVANLPQRLQDNAVAANDGKLYSAFGFNGSKASTALYAYDPDSGAWSELAPSADTRRAPAKGFIDGKLYAVGGWSPSASPDTKLEIYDPSSDKWTTGADIPRAYGGSASAVLKGKLYVVGGCTAYTCGTSDAYAYDASTDSWSAIAPYPESVSWSACGGIGDMLYCAGGTNDSGTTRHGYAYDPSSDSWSPIADLPTDLWGSSYTAANGLLLTSGGVVDTSSAITNQGFAFDPVAGTWSNLPNANIAVYRGGGAPGFYSVGGNPGDPVPVAAVQVLPGYDQAGSDVTWLSLGTQQATLAPGASTTVVVTLDASAADITQPGDYTTKLGVRTDTPYKVSAIPVTMHVNPPKTWGKYAGTVLGADGKGGTVPLAGATVQIDSWASSYTLKTGKDGSYALWLDTRNNPLTVIVAKDGYQPTTTTVKIVKGATTTGDFTLKKST